MDVVRLPIVLPARSFSSEVRRPSADVSVEELDAYQHDYEGRHFFFLPAVMTTAGRISGDLYCSTSCPTARRRSTLHVWAS